MHWKIVLLPQTCLPTTMSHVNTPRPQTIASWVKLKACKETFKPAVKLLQELKAGPTETPDSTIVWTRSPTGLNQPLSRNTTVIECFMGCVLVPESDGRDQQRAQSPVGGSSCYMESSYKQQDGEVHLLWMNVWGECQTLFIMNTCCSLIRNVGKLWTSDWKPDSPPPDNVTASVLCFILSAVKKNSSLYGQLFSACFGDDAGSLHPEHFQCAPTSEW